MTTLKCDVCSGTIENLREIAPSCKAPGCTGHFRVVEENAMKLTASMYVDAVHSDPTIKCERCGRNQPVGFQWGCRECGWNTLAEKEQRERAEKAEDENKCDACAGTGATLSGAPCMCGGTGKLSDAVPYLRGKMLDVMSDRNRYKSLHDAMRADATIGVAALPLIRDALLATDDETTLDAVRRLMSTLRSLWNERDTLKAELAKAKSDLEISESFTAMRERAEKAELKRDTYKAELAYHIGLPHCASITDLEKRLKEAEHIVAACKAWREYAAVEAAQGGCVQFVTMKMLAAILRGHKPLEQT